MIDGAETCLVLIFNTCIRFFFRSWGFSLQRENADFVQADLFRSAPVKAFFFINYSLKLSRKQSHIKMSVLFATQCNLTR